METVGDDCIILMHSFKLCPYCKVNVDSCDYESPKQIEYL